VKTITRPVLAAAYPGGRRSNPRTTLTHAIELDSDGRWLRVLCKRVELDSLCDYSDEPDETPPTCPRCASVLVRQG
jgi:hypothetical protein